MVYSIIISSCFGKKRNLILLILDLYWSTDNPIVISILDGSTLRLLFEDEDDFAMLAENLFTDLDVEDKGKISKSQIRSALVQMGVDMGVPPFSGSLYFWVWSFFFFFVVLVRSCFQLNRQAIDTLCLFCVMPCSVAYSYHYYW